MLLESCLRRSEGRRQREKTKTRPLGNGDNMDGSILIYNNRTGIAQRLEPMFWTEKLKAVVAADTQQLRQMLADGDIQLILADVELDDKGWDEGIELIASLRQQSRVPLIVVSEQSAETAKIMALEAGADDYVTVECNPLELMARIKCQLRRYCQLVGRKMNEERVYQIDGLVVDDTKRTVTVDGKGVRLTPIEYKILCFLARQRGTVFSTSQIYENIWKMQAFGADTTIAVHVRHIREKIESNPREPRYLKAVWGNGYKVG